MYSVYSCSSSKVIHFNLAQVVVIIILENVISVYRYMYPKSHKKVCGYNFLPTSCFQKWFCVNEGLVSLVIFSQFSDFSSLLLS